VSTIDTSTTLFGKQLTQPIYFSITGGKNCFFPNGEQETALAAVTSNSMMITGGGINNILSAGKGPKVWWQFTSAAELRTKNQAIAFGEKLQDQGCSGISVTVDIYHVSHRERSIHNGLVRNWCQQAKGIPRNAQASWSTSRTIFSDGRRAYLSPGHFNAEMGHSATAERSQQAPGNGQGSDDFRGH
jgi:isopentenyl diphosphate isomerase/L-lactate dehydrogenase-like FMN-dependent dehydrogenase